MSRVAHVTLGYCLLSIQQYMHYLIQLYIVLQSSNNNRLWCTKLISNSCSDCIEDSTSFAHCV